jgi:hypothetical protein
MQNYNSVNVKANATIRKGQIVKLSAGLAVPCNTQGEAFFGVAMSDAVADELVQVCVSGECVVEVDDATLIVGDFIATKNNGTAKKAVTGDSVVGIICEPGAAGVSGNFGYRRCIVRAHNRTL